MNDKINKLDDDVLENVSGGIGGDESEKSFVCPYCNLFVKISDFSDHKNKCGQNPATVSP
ncbi:MAG: hypothetical protein K6F86_00755 [Lachnospiraceae bacterium]|nr:hypothetical protein [Lachnospiraceae bacterium]